MAKKITSSKPAAPAKPPAGAAKTVTPPATAKSKAAAPAAPPSPKPAKASPAKPAASVIAKAKTPAPAVKPKRAATAKKAAAFSNDDIALRAYFIAEKRRAEGRHGSEHGDWVEAERQLTAENSPAKKRRK